VAAEIEEKLGLGEVDPLLVFGSGDTNLRLISRLFPVRVVHRNGDLSVVGEQNGVTQAVRVLSRMVAKARRGEPVVEADVLHWRSGNDGHP
jgi:phosphate starvation-inducible protein PhoH